MITGFHENQAELSETFAESFTIVILASTNSIIQNKVKDNKANAFYGDAREVEKIKLDFRNEKEIVSVHAGVKQVDHIARESISSGNVVIQGKLLLSTISTYGKRGVVFNEQLLKECGYITEDGALGKPPTAPLEFGNIKVLRFDLIGGFNPQSMKFGDMYLNQQLIDFSVYDKNIQDV